jgi:hypothetical protein
MEMMVLGTTIFTEFQKPTWMPLHSNPVQALDPGVEAGAATRQRKDVAQADILHRFERRDHHHVQRQQEENRTDEQEAVDADPRRRQPGTAGACANLAGGLRAGWRG